MHIQLRLKILLTPIIVALLAGACMAYVLNEYLVNSLKQQIERESEWKANSVLQFIASSNVDLDLQSLDRIADNLTYGNRERITIIMNDGEVRGDSMLTVKQLETLENHANRPEVRIAREIGIGTAWRYSNTIQSEMLYKARFGEIRGTPVFVRIAIPLSAVQASIGELRTLLLLLGVAGIILVLVLSFAMSRLLERSVQQQHQRLEFLVSVRTRELMLLERLGNLLTVCGSVEDAGKVLQSLAPELLGEHIKGALSIMNASRNRMTQAMHWGGDWPGAKEFPPLDCLALRRGNHYISRQGQGLVCKHIAPEQEHTLCLPLIAQGELLGALHLQGTATNPVQEDKQQVAISLAEHVSLALANIELHNRLREQALRDPLTGLYNRRYLEEVALQLLSSADRLNQPLALLMMDLDNFKQFNDNFGHDAGDYALTKLGRLLKACTRRSDIVSRFGGEEFLMISPGIGQKEALNIAQKLCDDVRTLSLNLNGQHLPTLTLSVGIAVYPGNGQEFQQLLKQADEALYLAKKQGRDRIVVAGPLSAA